MQVLSNNFFGLNFEFMDEYPYDYQISECITWFFLGENDSIAQFTSAGTVIPNIIAKNARENQILIDYFNNLPVSTEVVMNPLLDKYFDPNRLLKPTTQRSYYAPRGLISFDINDGGLSFSEISYHLIAQPLENLDFNTLPEQIKEILLKTKQSINFKDFYKIDEGYIPWASLFTDYYVPLSYNPKSFKKKKFWWFFT